MHASPASAPVPHGPPRDESSLAHQHQPDAAQQQQPSPCGPTAQQPEAQTGPAVTAAAINSLARVLDALASSPNPRLRCVPLLPAAGWTLGGYPWGQGQAHLPILYSRAAIYPQRAERIWGLAALPAVAAVLRHTRGAYRYSSPRAVRRWGHNSYNLFMAQHTSNQRYWTVSHTGWCALAAPPILEPFPTPRSARGSLSPDLRAAAGPMRPQPPRFLQPP